MRTWEPKLFPDYLNDYSARRKRATGHSPAVSTLRTKEGHLSTALRVARIAHDDEASAGALLADRDRALALVEAVLRTMTSGGARAIVFTLVDYGEYLHRTGATPEFPRLKADDAPPMNPQGVIRTFTPAEVELLISAARGVSLRWFGFVATLAETGRRPGEVLNLEWQWARLDSDPPHFIMPTTKTRRPQALPLTERLMAEVYTPENVQRLKMTCDRKYQRSPLDHPFPMSYTSVNGQWQRFTERLGLERRGGLHKLRHSKATQLLTQGVPVHAVARLLGHASVNTTMRAYDGTSSLTFAHYLNGER
jgi:integrase